MMFLVASGHTNRMLGGIVGSYSGYFAMQGSAVGSLTTYANSKEAPDGSYRVHRVYVGSCDPTTYSGLKILAESAVRKAVVGASFYYRPVSHDLYVAVAHRAADFGTAQMINILLTRAGTVGLKYDQDYTVRVNVKRANDWFLVDILMAHKSMIYREAAPTIILMPTSSKNVNSFSVSSGGAFDVWGVFADQRELESDPFVPFVDALVVTSYESETSRRFIPINVDGISLDDSLVVESNRLSNGSISRLKTGIVDRMLVSISDVKQAYSDQIKSWWGAQTPLSLMSYVKNKIDATSGQGMHVFSGTIANEYIDIGIMGRPYENSYRMTISLENF